MSTLRQAVREYLDMRRALGFKLLDAGKGLINFITFMEQHNASQITRELALAWFNSLLTFNLRNGQNA